MRNSMTQQRRFTKEFEEEAVRLVQTSGRTQRAIAGDLGIGLSTLVRWIGRSRDRRAVDPSAATSDITAELKRLRRENEILRQHYSLMLPITRACAREAPGYSLNSRDFRRARSPQARLTECFHMYRLHTKKRPSVARHKRCVACHVDRPRVRSKNVYRGAGSGASTDALREIGAPRREIGVELDVYPRDPP